jgi:molybdate transport system substrate-binding protein
MKYQLIVAAACGLMSGAAHSAEITVLSSGAVREILTELLPQFEKSSGHKVAITWSGTAKIKKQIGDGDALRLRNRRRTGNRRIRPSGQGAIKQPR